MDLLVSQLLDTFQVDGFSGTFLSGGLYEVYILDAQNLEDLSNIITEICRVI